MPHSVAGLPVGGRNDGDRDRVVPNDTVAETLACEAVGDGELCKGTRSVGNVSEPTLLRTTSKPHACEPTIYTLGNVEEVLTLKATSNCQTAAGTQLHSTLL